MRLDQWVNTDIALNANWIGYSEVLFLCYFYTPEYTTYALAICKVEDGKIQESWNEKPTKVMYIDNRKAIDGKMRKSVHGEVNKWTD